MENLSERAEEILETLWVKLEEERSSQDIGTLRDDFAVKELVELGYITSSGDIIDLTQSGHKEAESCIRRHRLAERLLVDVLDIKKGLIDINEVSCRFEHLLHKGLEENICTLLGHPRTCPHGKPIPEGRCCQDLKKKPWKLISPLSDLSKGQKGKIAYIHTEDHHILRKLMAMGTLPGSFITLIQRFPSYVFQIGHSQFAIDKNMASHIYIRLVK